MVESDYKDTLHSVYILFTNFVSYTFMEIAKLSKNGTTNLPASIRKVLNIKFGERVSFIIAGDKVILVPIKKMEELIDPGQYEETIKIFEGLKKEHRVENR